MVKNILIILFAGIFYLMISGCATTKTQVTDLNSLNGIWKPIEQEIGGKELPKAAFEKQSLTISDTNYIFVAESEDKGSLKYSNGKMDIYGIEGVNAGKHFTAIYKLESGQLKICYNLKGDNYPEAFETKSNPTLFLSVFQKEQTK